jgi:Asp-tRNA(Asn)/Glu-tRNA(Gln) amidotransferase C subunit
MMSVATTEAEQIAAEFERTLNGLFDQIDKLPPEHREKAFQVMANTPWFRETEHTL